MNTFTMITRHGASKDNISGYTLISSDYQTVTMSTAKIQEAISAKKIAVTNLDLSKKGLVSTNGALDKYTFINMHTNQVEGIARAVILNRVEKAGKLVGYTMFTQTGTIAEVNIADAAALANKGLISNGKVRHTSDGDIVSAIGGTYPLREIEIDKAPKGEVSAELMYFGTVTGTGAEYFGAIVSCTSAAEMSKLTDILNKSNAKIISEVAKVGGQSVRESLAIKRMGANSLYGVFDISILEKLAKVNAKISNKVGNITVSAIKYTNGSADEATAKLNSEWKIVDSDTEGSEASTTLKAYTKKIITKFSSIKIG